MLTRVPEPRTRTRIAVDGLRAKPMLAAAGLAVLGASLAWSRLVGLNQGLWHDEIHTVVHYVRPGPAEVFLGDYFPNNHMLFSLLSWLTTSVFGESEVALRAWSAGPFIVGCALGTTWLARRFGMLVAALYLFFATQSTILLEVSPQARGYGLAFLAMSVLTIAACEADRSQRRLPIVAFCAAGVTGTWTLPVFGLAFGATSLVLLLRASVRKRLLPWLGVSTIAVVVWYVPVLDQLAASSQQRFGAQLDWHAPLTAPIRLLLFPSLSPADEDLVFGVTAVFMAFGFLLVAGIRTAHEWSRSAAAVLASGVVATFFVLTVSRLFVEPRFASHLLVPVLMLLALGMASVLRVAHGGGRVPQVLVFSASGALLVWLAAVFVVFGLKSTGWPVEAHKDVAAAINELPPAGKIVVNLARPDDLRFYLRRPIVVPPFDRLQQTVCARGRRNLVYVENDWNTAQVDVSCLVRAGATRQRLPQRHRGDWIDVWFLQGTAAGS